MSAQQNSGARYRILNLDLSLEYRHGLGATTPFFQALIAGKALASCCPTCGDVRFPPRAICFQDGSSTEEFELTGEGRLTGYTIGQPSALLNEGGKDRIFGEVAMDGANNRVFARIEATESLLAVGQRVHLARPNAELRHPIQAMVFVPILE